MPNFARLYKTLNVAIGTYPKIFYWVGEIVNIFYKINELKKICVFIHGYKLLPTYNNTCFNA